MKFVDLNLYKKIRNDYVLEHPEFSYYDNSLIGYYFSGENLLVQNEFKDIELEFILALLSEVNIYSRKTQILVLTPDRTMAKFLRKLIREELGYLEVAEVEKGELLDLSLNRHIIVGTPGMVLDYLEEHPKSTDHIKQCYLIDAHKIFELGYFSTIKRIFNRIQSRVGITSDRVDEALIRVLDNLGLKYRLTQKQIGSKKKSYTKPKLLLASIDRVRNKNILIIVKKKKHLKLLKDYFEKKNFSVSKNYNVVYQYKNDNIIYIATKDELKDLNLNRFDLIFNYNAGDIGSAVRKTNQTVRTDQLKDFMSDMRGRLEAGIHKARTNLSHISATPGESLKALSDRYRELSEEDIKLKKTDQMRRVIFASLLPREEISENS